MSSPAGRTCCQGAAARRIVNEPSSPISTSSIMITASYCGGTTLPVLTRSASSSRTGRPSLAPAVAAARTAIPSMAERWTSGTENRA